MDDDDLHFDCYWEELQILARKHGERVLDCDAWREPFDGGKTARQAFFDEFPEHLK